MLKFEGIATIGDRLRAYDFEPRTDRKIHYYAEGYVVGIYDAVGPEKYKAYEILCDNDTLFNGKRIGERIFVPMETIFDYDERVTVLKD